MPTFHDDDPLRPLPGECLYGASVQLYQGDMGVWMLSLDLQDGSGYYQNVYRARADDQELLPKTPDQVLLDVLDTVTTSLRQALERYWPPFP